MQDRGKPSDGRLQQWALRYLTGRDRTEAQLRTYLLRKGASAEQLEPLLHRLQALGYLDDERYATCWAKARLRAKPMGRARLEQELRARGIPTALARRTLDGVYAEQPEADLARQLLTKRRTSLRKPSRSAAHARRAAQARVAGLLQRHGFGSAVIRSVLRGVGEEGYTD